MFNMSLDEIIFTHPDYGVPFGVGRQELNMLYNAADCYVSTSTGEGWGICTTEAMAAGVPVVVPRNTSHVEIVGSNEERGYLAACGGINNWTCLYGLGAIPRETVDGVDMIRKLACVYSKKPGDQVEQARQWTIDNSWEVINKQWEVLWRSLANSLPQHSVMQ
jgi:glycosyltransferase involved in cell wall biosynthesis